MRERNMLCTLPYGEDALFSAQLGELAGDRFFVALDCETGSL